MSVCIGPLIVSARLMSAPFKPFPSRLPPAATLPHTPCAKCSSDSTARCERSWRKKLRESSSTTSLVPSARSTRTEWRLSESFVNTTCTPATVVEGSSGLLGSARSEVTRRDTWRGRETGLSLASRRLMMGRGLEMGTPGTVHRSRHHATSGACHRHAPGSPFGRQGRRRSSRRTWDGSRPRPQGSPVRPVHGHHPVPGWLRRSPVIR